MADIIGAEVDSVTQDIKDMIRQLDLMDENIGNAVAGATKKSAEIIVQKQREIISRKSDKLAGLIKVQPLRVGKKGQINAYCGYNTEAVKNNMESVVLEFGRPGKRSKGKKMKQTYTGKNGEKYTVEKNIGKMEAVPHIRAGFDLAVDDAVSSLAKDLEEVIKW